jgi:hypothetical protein
MRAISVIGPPDTLSASTFTFGSVPPSITP